MKTGTKAPGRGGPQQTPGWVRAMFARVVPRYDLLNHLLSLNLDRRWRTRTARRLSSWLRGPGVRGADLCCGTGELLAALVREAQRWGSRPVLIGCDFCRPMLVEARRKLPDALLVEADALALPFPDASLDLVTIAFGLRNLSDYRAGLHEMRRLLRPSGVAAVLEFSRPANPAWRAFYDIYSRWLLPRIGGWISGSPEAYRYLPESVRSFPDAERLGALMKGAGFSNVQFEAMSGGIVALHVGVA